MEINSAIQCMDVAKVSDFSLSVALCKWLNNSASNLEVAKLQKYLTVSSWNLSVVEECLSEIAGLLMEDTNLADETFAQVFAPILVALVERAFEVKVKTNSRHLSICLLLGKMITFHKPLTT